MEQDRDLRTQPRAVQQLQQRAQSSSIARARRGRTPAAAPPLTPQTTVACAHGDPPPQMRRAAVPCTRSSSPQAPRKKGSAGTPARGAHTSHTARDVHSSTSICDRARAHAHAQAHTLTHAHAQTSQRRAHAKSTCTHNTTTHSHRHTSNTRTMTLCRAAAAAPAARRTIEKPSTIHGVSGLCTRIYVTHGRHSIGHHHHTRASAGTLRQPKVHS